MVAIAVPLQALFFNPPFLRPRFRHFLAAFMPGNELWADEEGATCQKDATCAETGRR